MQAGRRLAALLLVTGAAFTVLAQDSADPLRTRILAHPYLRMPASPSGKIPALLSQTGAFRDTRNLVPSEPLIPYDLIVPFWSDGAHKLRWIAVPDGKIQFAPSGEWTFPAGTVFVKTFELPLDARDPTRTRRLETRLLMVQGGGAVYGVVYKWRSDLSDADLLPGSLTERVAVTNAAGETHEQTWYYPSRKDCITCHTRLSSGVLGVKARQLNHDFVYPSGVKRNELRAWNDLGLFEPAFHDGDEQAWPRLAASADTTRSLQDRARSYFDANCSACHRPGGTVAGFDARYDTPLAEQSLVNGPVLLDQGIDRPRIISPHDIWRSIAYMRVDTVGDIRMPPLDRETIDPNGVALLREWIDSMPGRPVLAPPLISPAGGTFDGPVEITLRESEPAADIHYTLDGSVPGPSDPRYQKPVVLSAPAVLRARAFKEGFTRSITSQEVFVVGR
ncbi:MAG TPA: chitobiase/beta-hexosaminidase C-terminal domain-containing protein [Steroidobacteraceae bacterium]|nr:chitobiase/beta-hexosaminidase C-terminal domain-containing protein [Steroidobacteraceae bacterium]